MELVGEFKSEVNSADRAIRVGSGGPVDAPGRT